MKQSFNFERDLAEHGYLYVWQRIRTLKSFREYYIHYPYDDTAKAYELDQHLGDIRDPDAVDPYEEAIQKSSDDEFFEQFNPAERQVALLTADSLPPREIAAVLGSTSLRVRQHKFSVKGKLKGE